MLERVLALAGQPAARARRRAGPSPRGRQACVPRSRPSSAAVEASAPSQKVCPTTEAGWSSRRSSRSSESSRAASSAWTVLGSASASTVSSSSRRFTISSANSGLPPERSATCGTTSAVPLPVVGSSASTSSRVSLSVSGSSEIVVALRRPPPQPGRRSSSSSRGQADEQERRAHPARQVLDQVEHPLVGPVDVLDREHERPPPGDPLDDRADGREERLAHPLRVRPRMGEAPRAARCRAGREQRGVPLAGRLVPELAHQLGDAGAELLPGGLGRVRVADLELVAQDLAERPVGDPRAVGGALAAPDRRWIVGLRARVDVSSRSSRDLPTPAWPITVTRWGRSSRSTRSTSETSKLGLLLAADQRRLGAPGAAPRLGRGASRLPGRHGLRLALQRQRLEALVVDRLAGRPVGRLADRDAVGPPGGLEPRGDVDRVADHRVAVAHGAGHHLAGVDPDAQREADAVLLPAAGGSPPPSRPAWRGRRGPRARGRPRGRRARRRRPSRCRR